MYVYIYTHTDTKPTAYNTLTLTFPAGALGSDDINELDNVGMLHLLENFDLSCHSGGELAIRLQEELLDGYLGIAQSVKATRDLAIGTEANHLCAVKGVDSPCAPR